MEKHIPTMQNLQFAVAQLNSNLENGKRQDLIERGKVKLVRLLKDCTVMPEVGFLSLETSRRILKPRNFPKGQLIEGEIRGGLAHVYLDDDGDGNLYFPASSCEEVELDRDSVEWDTVVLQG